MEVYRDAGPKEPLVHRALALWFMQQMGLPVATPVSGVAADLASDAAASANAPARNAGNPTYAASDSIVFAQADSPRGKQMATLLVANMARATGAQVPDGFDAAAGAARAALANDPAPLVQSLLAMSGDGAGVDPSALLAKSSADYPTLDRALTLLWLRKTLGGDAAAGSAAALPSLQGAGWTRAATPTGTPSWKWTGAGLPATLDAGAARPDINAIVSFRSRASEESRLNITVARRFYKLEPREVKAHPKKQGAAESTLGRSAFTARLVKAGDAIDSNALYVDEVALTPRSGNAYHYGLLDVPLPPGGSVEATSWGVSVEGLPGDKEGESGPQPFARAASYEMGELSYHQPVPLLDRPVVCCAWRARHSRCSQRTGWLESMRATSMRRVRQRPALRPDRPCALRGCATDRASCGRRTPTAPLPAFRRKPRRPCPPHWRHRLAACGSSSCTATW